MFGDRLTAAHAKISSLAALIAATGFKLDLAALTDPKTEATVIPSADEFRAHLAQREKTAVDAAVAPLNVKLGELGAEAFAATAFRQGLADAGVKVGDFIGADKAEGKTPEEKTKAAAAANAAAVKTAVETAVANQSVRQVAAAGHPNAIPVKPGAGAGANDAKAEPQSREEFSRTLESLAGAERQTYFRKHRAKFPVS